MQKKILLTIAALPVSAFTSFVLAVLYLLARELLEYGYIDKYNSSDQLTTQLGIVMIFFTIILYGVLTFLIFTKIKSPEKKR